MHRSSQFGRTLAHARREAWLVGLVWLLALAWTVGYCWLFGYAHPPQSWWVRALGALAEGQPGARRRRHAGMGGLGHRRAGGRSARC
jgi:hypothetical protein